MGVDETLLAPSTDRAGGDGSANSPTTTPDGEVDGGMRDRGSRFDAPARKRKLRRGPQVALTREPSKGEQSPSPSLQNHQASR